MKGFLRERFGIFDMRVSARKWPRIDGGRWFVRVGNQEAYTKSFVGAIWWRWSNRKAAA